MEIKTPIDHFFENGLISSAIAILSAAVVALLLNSIANRFIQKKFTVNIRLAKRIKKIILWTFMIACTLAQIRSLQNILAAMLASGGILAIIVGLASQEAATSLISGFMIYSSKPFKIGDFIVVPEHQIRGTVLDITLRHTLIETLEKTQIIIPNTVLNKAVIENVSNISSQKANHLFLEISYESDMDKAIAIIQETIEAHPLCIDIRKKKEKQLPKVPVHCMDFLDSGIQLRATAYTKDNKSGFTLLSDVRKQIKRRFDEEGIVIPYPHTVIIDETKSRP